MPRINILFLVISFSLLTGCFDEAPKSKHGLSMIPISQFTYRGVVERTIKLSFKIKKDDVTKIIARIETEYDYDFPLNYEWRLGQNVSLASGSLKGEISKMEKDTPLEVELEVTGFNSEDTRFVRFEVMGTNPNKRAFVDGIASSHPEKSFEKVVQEVEEYKKGNQ